MPSTGFTTASMPDATSRDRAVARVAEAAHRLNEAVRRALDAGYSVELVRTSRAHDGDGNWGDQVAPSVRDKMNPAS